MSTAGESWSKALHCPVCGREATARLSHVYSETDPHEPKTVVEVCPAGFEVRQDEDDANIVRFFCKSDDVSADQ